MKILFVNDTIGYEGGLEQYIHVTSKLLLSSGHQNIFLHSGILLRDIKQFSDYFQNTYQITSPKTKNYDPARLKNFIKNEQPDIAFMHKLKNPELIRQVHKFVPAIRMIHDHEPFCLSSRKYHFVTGKICHQKIGFHCYLYPGCYRIGPNGFFKISHGDLRKNYAELTATHSLEKVIVASKFMKKELIRNGYDEGKVAVLPLFVNPSIYDINHDHVKKKDIIFIGQLNRSKGLDLLLKCLQFVKIDYRLIVMGDGKSKKKYERLANRAGIANRTVFTGWLSHAEMESYYQKAGLMVMPSRWPEPFGLVGLEAMAHGVPVVAFNVGGIPDWLEHGKNGFLIERGNLRQLAEKIELLLTDKDLTRKLGDYGRQCVITRYNADDYVKKLVAIFEQAILSRRGN